MCDAIIHRGPDDDGYFVDATVEIGMRRLSIIDLATGRQPVSNEDGTVQVVFNGEIYNYRELRRDLEARGHAFRTTSDTETIVHLYEDHGWDLVHHLRGMFAIALWDTRARTLLLARGRIGIKPLYYAPLPGRIAFGSEVRALLEVPGVRRAIDWRAAASVLSLGCTPADRSILEGIRKLEPGHRALVSADGRVRIDRYWDLRFEPDGRITEDECVEQLRALLVESVDLHRRSDVPVGVFLSGGVDSSAVLATLTRVTTTPVMTFSIGFSDEAFNELPYAAAVARRFGADHHEFVLEPRGLDVVEDLAVHFGEPFGDSSAIPTYMVSALAARHVKVVLSGDGGDEVFAGYEKYIVESRERRRDHWPWPLRRLLGALAEAAPEGTRGREFFRHLALDGALRYLDAQLLFDRSEQRRLLTADVRRLVPDDGLAELAAAAWARHPPSWLSAAQYLDFQSYLPLDILTKVDRMSMAHSLEVRPPLLDHVLVEAMARVPSDVQLRRGTTKRLLKRAMQGVLPDVILERPKQGFAVPLRRWFRGDWAGYLRDVLQSPTCRARGIFEPTAVDRLLQLYQQGRPLDHELWTLLSFELWCRRVLDAAPAVPAAATRDVIVTA